VWKCSEDFLSNWRFFSLGLNLTAEKVSVKKITKALDTRT
jgi:hypothetical protein